MSAIVAIVLANIRSRRLQTAVIAIVVLLSSGAATLALSLAIETDAPYQHAFNVARGAHLTIDYAAGISPTRLRATTRTAPVTASAGPWREVHMLYGVKTGYGEQIEGLEVVGRKSPNTPVDLLSMHAGRWASAPGEVVVSQHLTSDWNLHLGERINPAPGVHGPSLLVVGIAASISPLTDAWVTPGQARALSGGAIPLQQQVLYRVRNPSSDASLRAEATRITAGLPSGSVVSVGTWLQVEKNADITASVMVPFLLAFSVFALVASVLIVANVVSGTVTASYRRIGVMKAIGFTPTGVSLAILGEVVLPAVLAGLVGVAIGTLAAQPFLWSTAQALGLPAPFTAALPVDVGVLALVLTCVIVAALVPARRAARMSAAGAIARGSAPSLGGSALSRIATRLPLPPAAGIGLGETLSRPLRSLMTGGAVLSGVATVIFAIGLSLGLGQVAGHLVRGSYVQIDVNPPYHGPAGILLKGGAPPGAPPIPSSRQIAASLRHNPAVARFTAEAQADVSVPGIAQPITYYAYRGASDWVGYALISGRWFSHPGEVVAPTRTVSEAGLRVGQWFTATSNGHIMHLRLVGEILDQTDQDLLLRGSWATLAAATPHLTVSQFEVGLVPGASVDTTVRHMLDQNLPASPAVRSGVQAVFDLLIGVIGALSLVLTLIAVAGVFDSVLLTTREGARDIAILKALGMAPSQVVAMVVSSVLLLGLAAGALGIPLGLAMQRSVLTLMGQIATGTAMPPAFFDLIPHPVLPLLALAGAGLAALGALLPAWWAARARIARVLQAE